MTTIIHNMKNFYVLRGGAVSGGGERGGAAGEIHSAKCFAFLRPPCYNNAMKETYLEALDEFFAAHYSDYIKLAALEGYRRPELLTVDRDGNIGRKDTSFLRLSYQAECGRLLETLKAGLTDTAFSFSFRPRTFRERWHDLFDKNTFAKRLPDILAHCSETAESAGKKLAVSAEVWQGIVKGKYYPEKNTVLALALVCHMRPQDTNALLVLSGYSFDMSSVRDVVVEYLLERELFNPEMRDRCLREYRIESLPIGKEE